MILPQNGVVMASTSRITLDHAIQHLSSASAKLNKGKLLKMK